MIKISNIEPVILETSDYRIEFANLEQALKPKKRRGNYLLRTAHL